MLRPAMSQILTRNESCYSFVVAVAKRARKIADDAVDTKTVLEEKPVKTAVMEFAEGKLRIAEPDGENAETAEADVQEEE